MKKELESIIKECYSKTDLCKRLGYSSNGRGFKKINDLIEKYSLDISHFGIKNKNRKYSIIEKECPVCGNIFETRENHRDEKTTCSHSCSNTYFRSGENNGNWKEISDSRERRYREICFKYHNKECVVCGEDKIVEVHHYNGNPDDEHPTNLIPLCPTHHQYWHSSYQYLIKENVDNYYYEFSKEFSKLELIK